MQGHETIRALVLAAGLSRRMGEFKPLLPLRGRTLIENSVGSVLAGGAETATVVTGYRAGDVERVLSRAFGERVRFVRNEAYAETDMVVGELLRRAAIKLRSEWVDGEEQEVEEHFKEPDFLIPFYIDKFEGDAYPTYAWSVNAIELEIDTYTGIAKVLGAYGSFDVGTPIDYNVVLGQMEGGFLQGIGYASIEKMDYDAKGRIRNNSFSDYLIPTTKDVPNLKCMLHVEKYPDGPYGAKGAGELPLVGAPGAYLEAVEQALGGVTLNHAPFTAEDTLAVIAKEGI